MGGDRRERSTEAVTLLRIYDRVGGALVDSSWWGENDGCRICGELRFNGGSRGRVGTRLDRYSARADWQWKSKECLPRQKTQKYDPRICLENHSVHGVQKALLRLINLMCHTSYVCTWLPGP